MKHPANSSLRPLAAPDERSPNHSQAQAIGRVLLTLAVALVVVIILVAESRLPEALRVGLFESTYTYP